MPEATNHECGYVVIVDARVRTEGPDENYFDYIDGECAEPADHRVVVQVEGKPDTTTDYLCCLHRSQVVDEIMHGKVLGVTIVADSILHPEIDFQVQPAPAPQVGWCYVVKLVSKHGMGHVMPPVMLKAATWAEAREEAAAQVEHLRELARGDDDGAVS